MQVIRILIAVGAWALALTSLAATAAAQGGRFSPRLDVFTHFTPVYMALAAVAFFLGLAAARGRGRIALVVATVIAMAGGALLVGPEVFGRDAAPHAAPGSPGEIKIIQFNAWSRNLKPDEAARWILANNPDIVVIEEGANFRGALKAAGYHDACRGCGAVFFSKAEPLDYLRERRRPGHDRFMGSATYQDALGTFTVIGVHRSWPTRFRKTVQQSADLERYIATQPRERLILAGDFNSTPWSFARRRDDVAFGLIRRTHALPTWPAERVSHNRLPSPFPYLPIDHLYAGPGWATVKVERGPKLGSDHYPIIVTLAPVKTGVN